MEVGIEECLHIEFEYDKNKYHMKDTVVGKIYFLLVRIKLKHMEIEIRRRETIGSGSNARNENETLAKYEIMDGAPVRGESVPIRSVCYFGRRLYSKCPPCFACKLVLVAAIHYAARSSLVALAIYCHFVLRLLVAEIVHCIAHTCCQFWFP